MESTKAEQQVSAEQLDMATSVESEQQGGLLGRIMWKALGIVLFIALAVVTILAEIWLITKDNRLLAVTGMLFFGYLFFICAFGIYFYVFAHKTNLKEAGPGH